MTKLTEQFVNGGPMMWPLLLCSIVSTAFIIERWWHYRRARLADSKFLPRFYKVVRKGRVAEAIEMCETHRGPTSSVLKAGLLKWEQGLEEMEKAIEFSAGLELARLERGLVMLLSIANIAPLMGFLGTVTGMINSFQVISVVGLNNPALVAIGISEALITTAAGLIIAIPTLAAYNYFSTRVSQAVLEIQESSTLMLDSLAEFERRVPQEHSSPTGYRISA